MALSRSPAGLSTVAMALWAQASARDVGRSLSDAGIPVLLLKGPELQQRLYGTPARYVSGDADILVPRSLAARARDTLTRSGWHFERENGVLWRLSAAATYERDGFRVDLHWGVHAGHLSATSLRGLEKRLWRGASTTAGGFFQPDAESLLVFLAVHVVGHDFERAHWLENVRAAAELVEDWNEVDRIAADAGVSRSVRAALEGRPAGEHLPVLDGIRGRAISHATWLFRGHFLPRGVRDEIRETFSLARAGYGVIGKAQTVTFGGLELRVDSGVFAPRRVSEQLVERTLQAISDVQSPIVVEAGSGSGAVGLAVARSRSDARVLGIDVSSRAVRCANRNARRLQLGNAVFRRGDLLDCVPPWMVGRVAVVVTNLPYVDPRTSHRVTWDAPLTAIEGEGVDGLGLMRRVADRAHGLLTPSNGHLVFQIGDSQWESFAEFLRSTGYEPTAPHKRAPNTAIVGSARLIGGRT